MRSRRNMYIFMGGVCVRPSFSAFSCGPDAYICKQTRENFILGKLSGKKKKMTSTWGSEVVFLSGIQLIPLNVKSLARSSRFFSGRESVGETEFTVAKRQTSLHRLCSERLTSLEVGCITVQELTSRTLRSQHFYFFSFKYLPLSYT